MNPDKHHHHDGHKHDHHKEKHKRKKVLAKDESKIIAFGDCTGCQAK